MKRSEMIDIIANHIEGCDYSDGDREEILDEAGYILSLLEKAGMLPPDKNAKLPAPEMVVNDWEPEDVQSSDQETQP